MTILWALNLLHYLMDTVVSVSVSVSAETKNSFSVLYQIRPKIKMAVSVNVGFGWNEKIPFGRALPDLVLKNLFSLIYIHKPKSYELFCNILEDFNFGDLLKLDIFNQFMEYFFSFWLFNGYEMILNCNLI